MVFNLEWCVCVCVFPSPVNHKGLQAFSTPVALWGGRAWWRRAAHVAAARKQKGKRSGTKYTFQSHTPSDLLHPIWLHLVIKPLSYEVGALTIQSPTKTPISEHCCIGDQAPNTGTFWGLF